MVVALGLGPLAGLASAAPTAPVACHTRLGPGGTVVLDRDLTCGPLSVDQDEALVILGPVTVDLNGHTITCVGGLRVGIQLGASVKLKNGTITGCSVGLETDGVRNTIERLTVTGNGVGIRIQGGVRNTLTSILADGNFVGVLMDDGADGNTLTDSTASNNTDSGFLVHEGDRNVLSGNRAIGNGRGFVVGSSEVRTQLTGNLAEHNEEHGFLVGAGASSIVLKENHAVSNGGDGFQIFDSSRTQVIENEARGNAANGFLVAGNGEDNNLLQRNSAVGNGKNGIAIDVNSIRNRVVGNTVTGHVAPFFDLLDMNPNCRRPVNTWTGNTFVTKSPDCLR
jgi:parallel beta-helix repeat protein